MAKPCACMKAAVVACVGLWDMSVRVCRPGAWCCLCSRSPLGCGTGVGESPVGEAWAHVLDVFPSSAEPV